MTMTEGSAEAGSPEAGNGETIEGSMASASDLLSGLDGDSRNWIDANGIKGDNPADLLSGLVTKSREMESLIGRSVRLPGEDATDEDVAGFYDRMTERLRPDDPSGYQYELPEGLPEEMPYDADFVDAWRNFSHELKLPLHMFRQRLMTGSSRMPPRPLKASSSKASRPTTKYFALPAPHLKEAGVAPAAMRSRPIRNTSTRP